ncbi:MAG: prepilin peptidase [Candidatus Altimarinota bacterium]
MNHFLAGIMTGIGMSWLFFWAVARDQELASSASMKWFRVSWVKAAVAVIMAGVLGMFFWMNVRVGLSPVAYFHVLSGLLIATALYDMVFRLIPSSLVILLIWVVFLGTLFLAEPLPVSQSSVGAVVVGGVVLVLYLLTKGKGIGEADIFLAGVTGALFGWEHGLLVFSVANFLGLVVILPLIAVLGKARLRQIPLVFFIVLAIFLEWYVGYCGLILTSLHLA